MKRYAFFVGIDSYSNGITPLRYACNDAGELFGEFRAAGFDKAVLIAEKDAESSNLIRQITEFCKEIQAGDLLVFYFAGHGREFNGEHYLIGKDGFADPALYNIGSLSISSLVAATNKPEVRRLFILDCCRDNLTAGRSAAYACENSRSIALDNAVKGQSGFIPPLILNSCSSGEKALEDAASKHGCFTQALLQTITDKTVQNFSTFSKVLNDRIKSFKISQNICWNGNINDWDEVKLFSFWDGIPQVINPDYPENYYDTKLAVEKSEKNLTEFNLQLSTQMSELKQKAELARRNGDFHKEIEFLQQFKALITAAIDDREKHIAETRRQTEEMIKEQEKEQEKKEKRAKILKISKRTLRITIVAAAICFIGCCIDNKLMRSDFELSDDDTTIIKVKGYDKKSVTVPPGVTTIAEGIFSYTPSVKVAFRNKNFTVDQSGALIDTKRKTLLYLPPEFSGKYEIPSNVKRIGAKAFYGCSKLTAVTIPDSVTEIGKNVFEDCSSLTSVNIPDGVKEIGANAFYGCSSLQNVTIPDSVTKIGAKAFYGCSKLTGINIPNGVKVIPYQGFYGCSSLQSITIPDSVTEIGYSAFSGCSSLQNVYIPDSVTKIWGMAFRECHQLRASIPRKCEIEDNLFLGRDDNTFESGKYNRRKR